ncbi:MAG: hypothetical protein EXR82_00585 [Gammaproteobacteria bacterium]|nr:hypothetical protein [Gammaproteobacteria bacterium]
MDRKAAVLAKPEWTPLPEPPEMLDELETPEPLGDETADDDLGVEALATDNVGGQSIEINIENLIAELEAESQQGTPPDVRCARRKLENYLERKRTAREIEDFEDFEVKDLGVG